MDRSSRLAVEDGGAAESCGAGQSVKTCFGNKYFGVKDKYGRFESSIDVETRVSNCVFTLNLRRLSNPIGGAAFFSSLIHQRVRGVLRWRKGFRVVDPLVATGPSGRVGSVAQAEGRPGDAGQGRERISPERQ